MDTPMPVSVCGDVQVAVVSRLRHASVATFSTAFVLDPVHMMDIEVTNLKTGGAYYSVEASTANGPGKGQSSSEHLDAGATRTFSVAVGDVIPKDKYTYIHGTSLLEVYLFSLATVTVLDQ